VKRQRRGIVEDGLGVTVAMHDDRKLDGDDVSNAEMARQ
jgi:hypothetical protein